MSRDGDELVRAWRAAAERREIREAIGSIHDEVTAAISSRGPACWASGRCCRFERAGHRLYVTGLETAVVLREVGGRRGDVETDAADRSPAVRLVADDRAGACPYVAGNLCSIHEARPLGCRVYFCDRGAEGWQRDLYERMLTRVRETHDRFGVAYRYAEWRSLLELFGP